MQPTEDHKIAAVLSAAAYRDAAQAEHGARSVLGVGPDIRLVDCGGGTQVLFAGRFIAFRGTDELADVADDLGCLARPVSGFVRAWGACPAWHRGFERAWLRAEPEVMRYLLDRAPRPVFCGHSLGGALALLAAAKSPRACSVVTFGAPRAGNASAMMRVEARATDIARYVLNSDVVPRLPPASSGLTHPQRGLIYIDAEGVLHDTPSAIFRLLDRFRGRLRSGLLDGLRDHSMDGYVRALHR